MSSLGHEIECFTERCAVGAAIHAEMQLQAISRLRGKCSRQARSEEGKAAILGSATSAQHADSSRFRCVISGLATGSMGSKSVYFWPVKNGPIKLNVFWPRWEVVDRALGSGRQDILKFFKLISLCTELNATPLIKRVNQHNYKLLETPAGHVRHFFCPQYLSSPITYLAPNLQHFSH